MRPITLLYVDVKFASRAMSNIKSRENSFRLNIKSDQYSYVKERSIFDAVRTIGDIMDYSKLHILPSLMVTIAFAKALDSSSWNFLFQTLEKVISVENPLLSGYVFLILIHRAVLLDRETLCYHIYLF